MSTISSPNGRARRVTPQTLRRPAPSAFDDGPPVPDRDLWSHVMLVLLLCFFGLVAAIAIGAYGARP